MEVGLARYHPASLEQDNLNSINDVMLSLETLEHDLPVTGVSAIRGFNTTYLIITKRVRQALMTNLFDYPDFLERFDARFGYYYTAAVKAYCNNVAPSPAWQKAFRFAEADGSSFRIMTLGVNAHVNNDIPLVLLDCKATDKYRSDYNLINKIIAASIDQVLDEMATSNNPIGLQRRYLRPISRFVIHNVMKLWRRRAWMHYEMLQHSRMQKGTLERKAIRTATYLRYLPL